MKEMSNKEMSNKELRDFLALQFNCSKNVAADMVHACISIYSVKVLSKQKIQELKED